MRSITIPGVIALALAPAACQNQYGNAPLHDDRGAYNAWAIETVNDGAVRNAIIAQHTLYPYHFVEFSEQLNELGKRDVDVLASHLRRYPGGINVHRAGESDALYQARVKAVADALAAGGVAPATIKIADGMPGGDGNPSVRVISIMEAERQRMTAGASTPAAPDTTATASSTSGTTASATGGAK